MKHARFLVFFLTAFGLPSCADAQEKAKDAQIEYREHGFYFFDSEQGYTADIALSDVDGDGDLDALTANGRHWAQQDFVFFNAGNGRMLEAAPIGQRLSASYVICPGDFDQDGDVDIVVVRDNLPAQLYVNDGAGNYQFATNIAKTGGHARSAIAADLNGDGALDVAIVRRRGADIIAYGNGKGEFSSVENLPGDGKGSTGIAVGNLDNDGDKDMVVARRDGQASTIMINAGSGKFLEKPLSGSTGDHRKTVIADFDQDGLIDIILVSTDGVHKLYKSSDSPNFSVVSSFGTSGRAPQSMASADLDGDGDVDLVEGTETANALYINNGKAVFEKQDIGEENSDTYGVAIGDMNGDGKLDIVFANSEAANIVMLAK